jgi:hypothetical protein
MKVHFSGAEDVDLNHIVIKDDDVDSMKIKKIEDLVKYVYENVRSSRKSFFNNNGEIANGTICLIDDQDIELAGDKELGYESEIVFISTLHGG